MRRELVATSLTALLAVSLTPSHADEADGATAAGDLTVTPAALSVTKGGEVTLTVQVGGAGGAQQLSYVVVGRNDGVHGNVTTGADGTATIGYRDRGGTGSPTSDTVAVIDAGDDESATGTVDFLDGPAYAQQVSVDASGLAVDDDACSTDGATPVTAVPLARLTVVCAAVTNALGEPLAGKPVVFTVSDGSVGPAEPVGQPEAAAESSYPATTDRAGVAFAAVTATTPGQQQVTATADRLSGHAAIGYAPPEPADAAALTVSPASASIVAGRSRRFVVRVVDGFGNPVGGVAVDLAVSDTGALAAGTESQPVTAADGTATVTVTTRRRQHGAGRLTATIASPAAQCPAGSCTAAASYTVSAPVVPTSLTVEAAPGARAGAIELVAAVVTGAGGVPAPGQPVHFAVAGTDAASGIVRTNAKGVALFGYPVSRKGRDTIRAWDDVNRDGRHGQAEPAGSLALVSGPQPGADRPKK